MVPIDLVNLLLLCCGLPQFEVPRQLGQVGGSLSQFWRCYNETIPMTRFLLLLGEDDVAGRSQNPVELPGSDDEGQFLESDDISTSQPSSSQTSKTLVLDLLHPKLVDFVEMLEPTSQAGIRQGNDAMMLLPTDRLRSMVACLISGSILLSHLEVTEHRGMNDVNAILSTLWEKVFRMIASSRSGEAFELILTMLTPYVPPLELVRVQQFCNKEPHLLQLLGRLAGIIDERRNEQIPTQDLGAMELDDGFESQDRRQKPGERGFVAPRTKVASSMSANAFFETTKARLQLLAEYLTDPGKVGLVPETFMDKFLSLEDDQFLLCREFLVEIIQSDFGNVSNYARDVIEQTAAIVFKYEYKTCEVALCMLVDVLRSFAPVWSMGEGDPDVVNPFVDLYNMLVKSVWPHNLMSPEVQLSYSELLLHLWEINAQFHKDKKSLVSPPHKTLLSTPESLSKTRVEVRDPRPGLFWEGGMRTKFYIAPRLSRIFEFFVVSTHEDIFLDILEALPSDPEITEGIGLRVFVLAGLGCKCPTLLRRCVYHIVETSAKVPGSAKYATRGMQMVSKARTLKSPQELFQLFAPQLLYTWLEKDSFEDIPFGIFGFDSLDDLLQRSSVEATAHMVMRGQDQAVNGLASRLQVTPVELVEQGFSKIMAYSIMHDIYTSKDSLASSETWVRKLLGKEPYLDHIYRTFADIVGHFCDLIDQEGPIEDAWRKDETFASAAELMDQIKSCGQSPTALGPNQQPMFKGKYLVRAISHLVRRTSYEIMSLWTPPLVTSVARRLLNTIHPALGPLHALSVIRKVRILVCLAGVQTTSSYPLEMLLRSIRPFLSNSQCADEALALSNWLISQGHVNLAQTPSFLAGYALSTLASLRMFLESSQASSTEESQFRSTVSKAQNFHVWFVNLLKGFDSNSAAFHSNTQAQAFRAIIESASNIRSSGNSQKDTQESRLLLEILKDAEQDDQLLDEPARDLALRMLCGEFKIPKANRDDIIDTDEDARAHGPMIWKSCTAVNSSKEYLTWAGRVVGTSYAASGSIPRDVLRESQLSSYQRTMGINGDSVHGLLRLLVNLTLTDNSSHAGLAESALRRIVSHASSSEDHDLIADCSRSLPENLLASSDWLQYHTPPTDRRDFKHNKAGVFEAESIESPSWAQEISIHLACSVTGNAVLATLPSILSEVSGFAEQALPFIAHLALLDELNSQRPLKRGLSAALGEWLRTSSPAASENIKLMLNVILHLRTRPFPNEGSITDRSHWLDLNLSSVAEAATRCGMFKVALLFAESAISEPIRSSRRSSASREAEDYSETLLKVFENIDDPDAYYGLNRTASLSNVLARLEFEKEGGKSLAFRGSQYDSHLRLRDPDADRDGQSLVQILSGLGLSGLSNSLLQVQQHHDDSASLESTFTTARRLEIWNLPAPPSLENHAATSYRAYQSIYRAVEMDPARVAVQDGLATTMRRLATRDLRVSELRQHLGTLAALTELDTVLGVTTFTELEKVLADFEARSTWMMSGRYATLVTVNIIISC
jgi:serine-protein kinase ATM